MRYDNELTRLLEDRYKKVYDPMFDEMVTKEEMEKRTAERAKWSLGWDIGGKDHSAYFCVIDGKVYELNSQQPFELIDITFG